MPTYDYICNDCGHHFEKFQPITAAPLTHCPQCQGQVRRLIGAGNGFLFKGNGFYVTDYRSPGYKTDKQKAEGATAGDDSSKSSSASGTDARSKTLSQNTVKKAEV